MARRGGRRQSVKLEKAAMEMFSIKGIYAQIHAPSFSSQSTGKGIRSLKFFDSRYTGQQKALENLGVGLLTSTWCLYLNMIPVRGSDRLGAGGGGFEW